MQELDSLKTGPANHRRKLVDMMSLELRSSAGTAKSLFIAYGDKHAHTKYKDKRSGLIKYKFNDGTKLIIVNDEITITQDDATTL